ncbi:MAG: NAD(P)/FAD-dependent oxidoreductase [Chitinophagaceae bacterium]|nr:MAG: NAD(P)/FAD-dependent oxidoreductase [Chitinophagaceae bacterium]
MPTALIIGAGPAGLTAAYELLKHTDIRPVIIEQDDQVGGLSKTVNYKGNRIDLGGHRFFSKSEKVVDWWLHFLPLAGDIRPEELELSYRNQRSTLKAQSVAAGNEEAVMLLRPRKSRIFYDGKFYDYPLKLNWNTLSNLGIRKLTRIGTTYTAAKLRPIKPEVTLEDFFINQFGSELYRTFFKAYTEKVWGVSCKELPATWGHQRVKDLNVSKALLDALQSLVRRDRSLNQKTKSTSLIEQFLYPFHGPGQMWETVAAQIVEMGGEIRLNTCVEEIECSAPGVVRSLNLRDLKTGSITRVEGDHFLSTMPVRALVRNLRNFAVPVEVREAAEGLEYRDFLIVGLLTRRLLKEDQEGIPITDNWIYLQDGDIRAGRMQLFHNWSPGMVSEQGLRWIGVEYFCNETDAFWQQSDEAIQQQAIAEMARIGFIDPAHVEDATVIRVPKAYPSYYGSYDQFPLVQQWLDGFENLWFMGRNGMHRYNNTDHSMLTAMAVVDLIRGAGGDKKSLWEINTEMEYHEEAEGSDH